MGDIARYTPNEAAPNPGGRPPKISKRRINAVVKALKACQSQKSAAISAGISEKTFYNYMAKARDIRAAREEDPDAQLTPYDDKYIAFADAIEQAEVEIEENLIGRIKDAGEDKWQANAWILERRWPDRWSQSQYRKDRDAEHDGKTTEFTVRISGPVNPQQIEGEVVQEGEDIMDADFEVEDE